jgi:cell division control protein 6
MVSYLPWEFNIAIGLFEASVDTLFTPPHTPSVEHDASRFDDMSIDLPIAAPDFTCSQDTPARAMAILSLVTPPITPSRTLHTLARTLLRSTTDSFAVVGRETERTFLSKFLQSFLDHTTTDAEECSEDLATSLYISGSPGTGKTALVKSVMTDLVDTRDDIRTAYINCMGLKDIEVLWGRILQAIGGATTSSKRTKAVSSSFTRLERRLSEDGFRWLVTAPHML